MDVGAPAHPFFARMSRPFTQCIGDKRFKFMHGHEVDPFSDGRIQGIGRIIGAVACRLEYRHGTCILSNDTVTDALLEASEQLLRFWGWLTRGMNRALRECYDMMPAEQVTILTRRIRTQHMLRRYYADKTAGLYDVAIVGHTHKAGTFGDWYFNCGSWTGQTNNFLRILPDGSISVFDWGKHGPRPNNTVVAS
jgi:hypothetical protein